MAWKWAYAGESTRMVTFWNTSKNQQDSTTMTCRTFIGFNMSNVKQFGVAVGLQAPVERGSTEFISDVSATVKYANFNSSTSTFDDVYSANIQLSRVTNSNFIWNFAGWNSPDGYSSDYLSPKENSTPKVIWNNDWSLNIGEVYAEGSYTYRMMSSSYQGTFSVRYWSTRDLEPFGGVVTYNDPWLKVMLGTPITYSFSTSVTDPNVSFEIKLFKQSKLDKNHVHSLTIQDYLHTTGSWTPTIENLMPFNWSLNGPGRPDPMWIYELVVAYLHDGDETIVITRAQTLDAGLAFSVLSPFADFVMPESITVGTPATVSIVPDSNLAVRTVTYVFTIVWTDGSSEHTIRVATATQTGLQQITFSPDGFSAPVYSNKSQLNMRYRMYAYLGNGTDSEKFLFCYENPSGSHIPTTLPESIGKPTPSAVMDDPTGLEDLVGAYVANNSTLHAVIAPGAQYGATVASIRADINATHYTVEEFTTNPLQLTATSLVITVVDSRGFTGTITYPLDVVEWFTPKIPTFAVHRGYYEDNVWTADDNGDWVKIDYAIEVAPILKNNVPQNDVDSLVIVTPEGEVEPQLPSGLAKFTASGSIYCEADTEQAYVIIISVDDLFTGSSKSITLSTAGVIMDFKAGGKGIGIGKVSELDRVLDLSTDWTLRLQNMNILVPDASTVRTMSLYDYIRWVMSQPSV